MNSVQDFKRWVLGVSDKAAAYDDGDKILEVIAERWDERGELHYEVMWSDSYMPQRHVLYKDNNYQPLQVEICQNSPPAFPWDPHMLRISWDTSIEPAKMVEDQPESAQLTEAYMTKKAAALACNATRTDLGLTEMQQQGHKIKAQAPELPWPACHAAKVFINTMHSANPDQDRQPTGQFAIHACRNMAHIHRPDGTYAGRLSRSRLDILYQAFLSRTSLNEAKVAAEFAEAVCALLIRYKDGFKETENNGAKLSNHWATPDQYMKALQEGLSLKIETLCVTPESQ